MSNLLITHAKLARNLGRPARVWSDTSYYRKLCTTSAWIAEPKKNGWRCLACAGVRDEPSMWSRHGRQIAESSYPVLRRALQGMPKAQIDGELMIKSGVLYAFDLLTLDGKSQLALPYSERRARLEAYLAEAPDAIRLVPSWDDKEQAYETALKAGDEGIVFKRRDSVYPSGQTHAWIKCRFSLLEREDVPAYT